MNLNSSFDHLARNAETVLPAEALESKLLASQESGRPLRVKLGFDPTSPDLHLGHAVVLRKLREFQELGHQIVLIVGGFTAQIGDPTGRNKTRPPLSEDQIERNAQTYLDQFGKVVNLENVEVRDNREWLDKLTPPQLLQIMSSVTVGQILQRHDFNQRYNNEIPIGMHELMYPIFQAMDSVEIKADIELGGSDQFFNCMLGRKLQASYGLPEQTVICMPLLIGLDGHEKMGKSQGNYIGLTEDPINMFGKVMSIPDELLPNYIDLASSFSSDEREALKAQLDDPNVNPMHIKKRLALNITSIYHSQEAANHAESIFRQRFQERRVSSENASEVSLSALGLNHATSMLNLCERLSQGASRSHLRSLFRQNAIKANGVVVTDFSSPLSNYLNDDRGFPLRIGKQNIFEVKQ